MNKALLEYEMKKRNISIDSLCEKIGISKTSFYRKTNGKSEFTLGEIQEIVKLLKLESPMEIFFAKEVTL